MTNILSPFGGIVFLGKDLHRKAVFAAILGSLIFGAPIYGWGTYIGNPHLAVAGSVLVLLVGAFTCVAGSKMLARH